MGSRALNSVPHFCKAITLLPSPRHRENPELSPAPLCFQAVGCFTTDLQVFPRLHPQPHRGNGTSRRGDSRGSKRDSAHTHATSIMVASRKKVLLDFFAYLLVVLGVEDRVPRLLGKHSAS